MSENQSSPEPQPKNNLLVVDIDGKVYQLSLGEEITRTNSGLLRAATLTSAAGEIIPVVAKSILTEIKDNFGKVVDRNPLIERLTAEASFLEKHCSDSPQIVKSFGLVSVETDRGSESVLLTEDLRANYKSASNIIDSGQLLSRTVVINILKNLSEFGAYLEKNNLVHRDLTPDNIQISADGDVKVLDFGSILALESDSFMAPDLTTEVRYAAPETRLNTTYSLGTDSFTVGKVVSELLMGKRITEQEIQLLGFDDVVIQRFSLLQDQVSRINDLLYSAVEGSNLVDARDIIKRPRIKDWLDPVIEVLEEPS